MSVQRLQSADVTICRRRGGERLQPDEKRPRRTVKNLLQEARIPPWQRDRLPFIYCGDVLACVPGLGVDWRFRARPGEASVLPSWRESGRS
jgi:tRNA(Ile)-lysidine synthase